MKITYLGTGAAEGIPALFCRCKYCNGVRERGGREIRSRSQIFIDGELSIDFPPDAFYHAAQGGADFSRLKYVLVTHSHMDHFYAHDFVLRGYKYAHGLKEALEIYGNDEVTEVFSECTRRELREDVKDNISLHALSAFEEVCFGGYRVNTLRAKHSSHDPLLYLIEKDGKRVLHLCDTGLLPEDDYEFLSRLGGRVDLITLDCTLLWERADENSRHMGVAENKTVLERLQRAGVADENTKKVITHFSHNSAPTVREVERAERELGAVAAYDGMEIVL